MSSLWSLLSLTWINCMLLEIIKRCSQCLDFAHLYLNLPLVKFISTEHWYDLILSKQSQSICLNITQGWVKVCFYIKCVLMGRSWGNHNINTPQFRLSAAGLLQWHSMYTACFVVLYLYITSPTHGKLLTLLIT